MQTKHNLKNNSSKVLLRRRNVWLRRSSGPVHPIAPAEEEAARHLRVEGILFLAKEPLPNRKIAQLADVKHGSEVKEIILKLNHHYDSRGQSFRIEKIAGGYRFMTKQNYSSWIRRLESSPPPIRFSRPVIETLSVIAYRQPVMRAEIEAVRGVGCGEVIRQLMERGLVRISGRSDDLGRPFLYSTTKTFLTVFGLNSLQELPVISLPEITATQPLEPVDPSGMLEAEDAASPEEAA